MLDALIIIFPIVLFMVLIIPIVLIIRWWRVLLLDRISTIRGCQDNCSCSPGSSTHKAKKQSNICKLGIQQSHNLPFSHFSFRSVQKSRSINSMQLSESCTGRREMGDLWKQLATFVSNLIANLWLVYHYHWFYETWRIIIIDLWSLMYHFHWFPVYHYHCNWFCEA